MRIILFIFILINIQSVHGVWCEKESEDHKTIYYQMINTDDTECSALNEFTSNPEKIVHGVSIYLFFIVALLVFGVVERILVIGFNNKTATCTMLQYVIPGEAMPSRGIFAFHHLLQSYRSQDPSTRCTRSG